MGIDQASVEATARAVTNLVGDGCIVRLLTAERRELCTVAVDHRDRGRREEMRGLLEQPAEGASAGWARQAIDKNISLRVDHAAAAAAVGATPAALPIHSAVLAPLRQHGEPVGVVIALRDSFHSPYTLREQQLVERLVVGGGCIYERPAAAEDDAAGPPADRVLEHAPAGIWVTGLDGVTTYVNEAVTALVGLPASDLVGVPMARFMDEPPRMLEARLAQDCERLDHRITRPDGVETWASVSSGPLTDGDGRRWGTVSTLNEISSRKQVDVELRLRAAANEAVAELAEWALDGESVDMLVHSVAATTADILGSEYASVGEVTSDGEMFVPRAVVGWDPRTLGQSFVLPEHGPGRLALDDDQPVVIADYNEVTALEQGAIPLAANIRSAVFLGIRGNLGLICAHSPRPRAFAGRNLSFLCSMANVLAARWEADVPMVVGAA